MASNSQWQATIILSAKLANGFGKTFTNANNTVNRLGNSVSHLTTKFLGLTAALLGARIIGNVLHHVFYEVGSVLRESAEEAWGFDKALNRIKSSFLANQRIGVNGQHATDAQKMGMFGGFRNKLMGQAVQDGIRPDVLAAGYNSMAQAGMTPKDIDKLMPGFADMLVAKDIHDPEQAMEKGRAFSRAIMKNQPLHLTRSDIGLATGLPEKQFKAMFAGLDVWHRTEMVAKLVNLQYHNMALNMNKTEEGVARTAEVWRWMYEYDVGEKMKDLQLEWDRFVNFIAPLAKPAFEKLLEDIKTWGVNTENYFKGLWAEHGQSITKFWNDSFLPGARESVSLISQIGQKFGEIYVKIESGFGGTKLTWVGALEKDFADLQSEINATLQDIIWFEDKFGKIIDSIPGWISAIKRLAQEAWRDLTNAVTGAWDAVTKFEQSPILQFIESMANPLQKATDSWKGLGDAINGATQNFIRSKAPDSMSTDAQGNHRGAINQGAASKAPSGINWSPNGLPFTSDDSGSSRINAIFNNPGALGPTKSALAYGGTPSGKYDAGHPFMKFPTKELGAAAQFSMWYNGAYRNHTLRNAIADWTGTANSGEDVYMSRATGIPLDAVITDDMLQGEQGIRLMAAQAHYEGANVLSHEQWKAGQDEWKRRQFKKSQDDGDKSVSRRESSKDTAQVTFHNTYHIHGATDPHSVANQIAAAHADQLRRAYA